MSKVKLTKSKILALARKKHPKYSAIEDGEYSTWAVEGQKVIFYEWDYVSEMGEPVFKTTIEELTSTEKVKS